MFFFYFWKGLALLLIPFQFQWNLKTKCFLVFFFTLQPVTFVIVNQMSRFLNVVLKCVDKFSQNEKRIKFCNSSLASSRVDQIIFSVLGWICIKGHKIFGFGLGIDRYVQEYALKINFFKRWIAYRQQVARTPQWFQEIFLLFEKKNQSFECRISGKFQLRCVTFSCFEVKEIRKNSISNTKNK